MRKTVVTPIVLKSVSLGIFNKQQAVAYRAENSNQKIAEYRGRKSGAAVPAQREMAKAGS